MPQDPRDEPASVLLERIRAEKAASETKKPQTPDVVKEKESGMTSASIVSKVWSFCTTLRDDGVGYGDYLEQLTYLIFLKMADEYAKAALSAGCRHSRAV